MTSHMSATPLREPWRGRSLVAGAALLYGTVTVGGGLFHRLGFSLYEIALYPLVLTHLMLLPALLKAPRHAVPRKLLPFFAVYGLIGALAELLQFGSIVLGVPIATAALLLYLQPIWTSLLSRVFLREQITFRKSVAIACAVAGALVLLQSEEITGADGRGLASAVLGGVFVALWVIWGRKSGIQRQHHVTTALGWSGFSAAWLLVLWPCFRAVTDDRALSRLAFDFAPGHWLTLAAFALLAGVLPSLLLFRGLETVAASTAGVILVLEPVSASLLAALLFGEPLGLHVLAGGSLILLANLVLSSEA